MSEPNNNPYIWRLNEIKMNKIRSLNTFDIKFCNFAFFRGESRKLVPVKSAEIAESQNLFFFNFFIFNVMQFDSFIDYQPKVF